MVLVLRRVRVIDLSHVNQLNVRVLGDVDRTIIPVQRPDRVESLCPHVAPGNIRPTLQVRQNLSPRADREERFVRIVFCEDVTLCVGVRNDVEMIFHDHGAR